MSKKSQTSDTTAKDIEKDETVVVLKGDNSENEISLLKNRVQELEQMLEAEKDGKLRALADCQNIKMRAEKRERELIQYSQTALLLKILDVVDDFRNVLISKPHQEGDNGWYDGVHMIYTKMLGIVHDEGVDVVEVKENQPFNPSQQEAIGFVTVTEERDNQLISSVVSNGYKKRDSDQMIKTAKVIVKKFA